MLSIEENPHPATRDVAADIGVSQHSALAVLKKSYDPFKI